MKKFNLCFLVTSSVFLAIGLPTFITGCNIYYPACLNYVPKQATIIQSNISNDRCVTTTYAGNVPIQDYYDCYTDNIVYSYDNKTCNYQITDSDINYFNNYQVGTTSFILLYKNNQNECTADTIKLQTISSVGISFLIFAAITIITYVVIFFVKRYNNHLLNQDVKGMKLEFKLNKNLEDDVIVIKDSK